jgi:hypothetical protein
LPNSIRLQLSDSVEEDIEQSSALRAIETWNIFEKGGFQPRESWNMAVYCAPREHQQVPLCCEVVEFCFFKAKAGRFALSYQAIFGASANYGNMAR